MCVQYGQCNCIDRCVIRSTASPFRIVASLSIKNLSLRALLKLSSGSSRLERVEPVQRAPFAAGPHGPAPVFKALAGEMLHDTVTRANLPLAVKCETTPT